MNEDVAENYLFYDGSDDDDDLDFDPSDSDEESEEEFLSSSSSASSASEDNVNCQNDIVDPTTIQRKKKMFISLQVKVKVTGKKKDLQNPKQKVSHAINNEIFIL